MVDVVINNAGVAEGEGSSDGDRFADLLAVNTVAPAVTTGWACEHMRNQNRSGSIINVSTAYSTHLECIDMHMHSMCMYMGHVAWT